MILETSRTILETGLRALGFRGVSHEGVFAMVGGSGPTLVLLHGALSRGVTTWAPCAARLRRDFRLVIPDLPGFGASAMALPVEEMGVREMARRLVPALSMMAGPGFHLAGVSLGGWVAARLALEIPEHVTSLVLVDAAGRWDDQDAARDLERLIMPQNTAVLRELTSRVLDTRFAVPHWLARNLMASYRKDFPALRAIVAHAEEDVLEDSELAGLRMPAMVIWGCRDRLIAPEVGEALARAIPGAAWLTLDKSAHVPMIQETPRFTQVLRDFLQDRQVDASARPGGIGAC